MPKTILITGTSTGLGKLTAKYFAQQGWNVAATMRTPEKERELTAYDNICLFKLDVTDRAQVATAIEQASASFVPHFRANKGGMIINISSFMGVTTAVPTGSLYNMSKFALEGLTEGLFYELKPLNIELRLVEPGGSKGNNFLENIVFNSHADITDYDAISAKVNAMFASIDPERLDDPQEIVDEIYALATGANQQFRTLVGQTGKDLMALRRSATIEEYLSTIAANFG